MPINQTIAIILHFSSLRSPPHHYLKKEMLCKWLDKSYCEGHRSQATWWHSAHINFVTRQTEHPPQAQVPCPRLGPSLQVP